MKAILVTACPAGLATSFLVAIRIEHQAKLAGGLLDLVDALGQCLLAELVQGGQRLRGALQRGFHPLRLFGSVRHIQLAGHNAFIGTEDKLIVVDLNDPLKPKVVSSLPFKQVRGIAVQFRFAFVTDADGFHVVDITEVSDSTRSG